MDPFHSRTSLLTMALTQGCKEGTPTLTIIFRWWGVFLMAKVLSLWKMTQTTGFDLKQGAMETSENPQSRLGMGRGKLIHRKLLFPRSQMLKCWWFHVIQHVAGKTFKRDPEGGQRKSEKAREEVSQRERGVAGLDGTEILPSLTEGKRKKFLAWYG